MTKDKSSLKYKILVNLNDVAIFLFHSKIHLNDSLLQYQIRDLSIKINVRNNHKSQLLHYVLIPITIELNFLHLNEGELYIIRKYLITFAKA